VEGLSSRVSDAGCEIGRFSWGTLAYYLEYLRGDGKLKPFTELKNKQRGTKRQNILFRYLVVESRIKRIGIQKQRLYRGVLPGCVWVKKKKELGTD